MTYQYFCQRSISALSARPHSQTLGLQLIWMVVTLSFIVPFGECQPRQRQQVIVTGACLQRCEDNRPKGHKFSFKFDCTDKEGCAKDCDACPKQVCDETVSTDKWHCPETAELADACRSICNSKRPKGDLKPYTLECQGEPFCYGKCQYCPKFVCNAEEAGEQTYHCPWTKPEGPCKTECDKARVQGIAAKNLTLLKPFNFDCGTMHSGDQAATDLCNVTSKSGPDYICSGNAQYTCPVAVLDPGQCRDFCEEGNEKDARVVNCVNAFQSKGSDQAGAVDKCKTLCKSCATSQGINFVCDEADPELFYCPEPGPENPDPKGQRSFKGLCKDKCDVSRVGGTQAYNLSCLELYSTAEERQLCEKICVEECPEDVCQLSPTNDTTIKCPVADSVQTEEVDEGLSDYEIATIVLGVLLALALILLANLAWYAWTLRRKLKQVQDEQTPVEDKPLSPPKPEENAEVPSDPTGTGGQNLETAGGGWNGQAQGNTGNTWNSNAQPQGNTWSGQGQGNAYGQGQNNAYGQGGGSGWNRQSQNYGNYNNAY